MRAFTFFLNAILTSITLVICLVNFILGDDTGPNTIFFVFLAFFQVSLSIGFTIYYLINDRKLFAMYLSYWFLVALYFEFLYQSYFYSCIFIALFHLYTNYCTFSNSKFNILKK